MDRHLPDALFGESSILSVRNRRISGQEACLSGLARRTPGAEGRSTAVKCRRGGHPGIQTFPPHRKQGSECGLKTAARTTRPVSCIPHDIALFCRHGIAAAWDLQKAKQHPVFCRRMLFFCRRTGGPPPVLDSMHAFRDPAPALRHHDAAPARETGTFCTDGPKAAIFG